MRVLIFYPVIQFDSFVWYSLNFTGKESKLHHFPMILGDEILAVNGLALQGMSHSEAISVFKNIRVGKVVLHLARRDAATRR